VLFETTSIDLRFDGRGGQGVVTLSDLFVRAAAYDGNNVQSIPTFGAERRGAKVAAYARISDKKIWMREPVSNPDVETILDQSLIARENNLVSQVKKEGILVLNSVKSPSEVKSNLNTGLKVYTVDATGIATNILGRPIVSTLMLGALLTATRIISLDSIKRAIEFGLPSSNIDAQMKAVEFTAKSTSCA
jgi:pyruvate ferredoxin oxidoreductase gamma subunit